MLQSLKATEAPAVFKGSGTPSDVPGSMPGGLYLDQASGDAYVLS